MKKIAYSTEAQRVLRRMPANMSALLRSKVEQYARDPKSLANNVKRLQGRLGFRLRVGDWRVIFDVSKDTVDVRAIGPRGGVYDEEGRR